MKADNPASVLFPELPRRAPRVASLYAHPEIFTSAMSRSTTTFPPRSSGAPAGASTCAPRQHKTFSAELLGRPHGQTSFWQVRDRLLARAAQGDVAARGRPR